MSHPKNFIFWGEFVFKSTIHVFSGYPRLKLSLGQLVFYRQARWLQVFIQCIKSVLWSKCVTIISSDCV